MARWIIDLVQTVHEGATMSIEAETQEQAEKLALDTVYSDNGPEWNFLESEGNAEVVGVRLCADIC